MVAAPTVGIICRNTPYMPSYWYLFVLSGDSFYGFALPSRYVSSALITHKRSHITASVLIRFNNVTQSHLQRERECIKGAAA